MFALLKYLCTLPMYYIYYIIFSNTIPSENCFIELQSVLFFDIRLYYKVDYKGFIKVTIKKLSKTIKKSSPFSITRLRWKLFVCVRTIYLCVYVYRYVHRINNNNNICNTVTLVSGVHDSDRNGKYNKSFLGM